MNPLIKERIGESILVKQTILLDEKLMEIIQQVTDITTIAFKADKKILLCGNGGSASDAQHIAAEFSGRYYLDREPLDAEALHTNTSAVTAIANDYGYDEVFARLVRSKGRQGDILYAFSTSGNSPSIINAIKAAKERFMIVVGMTGGNGGKMNGVCDYLIKIPSIDTPRIQECHILVGHIICELVESVIFKK